MKLKEYKPIKCSISANQAIKPQTKNIIILRFRFKWSIPMFIHRILHFRLQVFKAFHNQTDDANRQQTNGTKLYGKRHGKHNRTHTLRRFDEEDNTGGRRGNVAC